MLPFLKSSKKDRERRRSERLEAEEYFFVEFCREGTGKMKLGQGKDLSIEGLRFATAAPVKKGEALDMVLYFSKDFPGARKIEARAVVHRVISPGPTHRLRVACEFQSQGNPLPEALSGYMEWARTRSLTLQA